MTDLLGRLTANDPRHGTANGYKNLGCRCDRCREAWRDTWRDYTHRAGLHRPLAEYRAETTSARADTLRCFKCRRWLPDTSFPRRQSNTARRGRHEWCTACGTASQRHYRASLAQRERANQEDSR